MTHAQISAVVEQIVAAVVHDYGLDADIITQASKFGDDLGMDGEDVNAIIFQSEETFKIKIHDDFDDAITEQSRVGDLTELISNLLMEKETRDKYKKVIRSA